MAAKKPSTASGRGNQLAGDYRSPTLVARAQCHHEKKGNGLGHAHHNDNVSHNIGLKSKSFGMPMKPRQYAKSLSRS